MQSLVNATEGEVQEVVSLIERGYTATKIAEMMGMNERTVRLWRAKLKDGYKLVPRLEEFTVEDQPREIPPIEELIQERIRKFKYKEKPNEVNINVNIDGPIGIAHFGDPHIDDDGTDIERLLRHASIVKETEGMFAGNVGDLQNNWVGRLAHLWSQQSTSAQEAWALTEYFVKLVPWLYLVRGNHDCWSGEGDPLDWIIGGNTVNAKHGVRIRLHFPNGSEITINARHSFRGHSQYNTTHAIAKAAQMGWDDDILVGGHTHVSGYQLIKNPKSGKLSHCLQIGSYKIYDRFAEEKGFADKNAFQCPVTIINPYAENPLNLVQVIFDPEVAAEYLNWIRTHGTK